MAMDKAVDSTQLNADLTAVANAIRTKGGTDAQLAFPEGFVSAVQAIEGAPEMKIVVTAVANAAVTATKGTESVSGTAGSNGVCTLTVPEAGTWTVTATSPSGGTSSTTCVVDFNYPVTIPFTFTVKYEDTDTSSKHLKKHYVEFNGTAYYASRTEPVRTFDYTLGEDELKIMVSGIDSYMNATVVNLADTSLGTLTYEGVTTEMYPGTGGEQIPYYKKTYAFIPSKNVQITFETAVGAYYVGTIAALES